ncbi:hypothetical protein CCACVL1_00408 [Corchorus capsularis]|uniref:Uncharacterized protein n=1 Tax=Corchorus capsularis TaxID=210143 RepID=A0A1R3KWW4_COCAP|nr:hypothetical protein CCACVL1_00408 [Corchorus capsularis]
MSMLVIRNSNPIVKIMGRQSR